MGQRELVLALVRLVAESTPERVATVREMLAAGDPDELVLVLARQRLAATLGGPLIDHPELGLPAAVGERIRAARMITRQRGLFQYGLTKRLTAALGDSEIPVVPLKGATLADSLYGDVGAREASDIDLLVPAVDLERATEIATSMGWREPEHSPPPGSLPSLHRELVHGDLPPLELHWRVHWYEESFAKAAIARAQRTEDGWLRPQPADEIAFLLLFLARDGFAGLRQVVDVAVWWAAIGNARDTAGDVRAVADRYPELEPALTAAGRYAERLTGIPEGSLTGGAKPSRRGRAALRLANPWFAGSLDQIKAEISLVDGLLTPRGGQTAFIRRELLIARWGLVRRQPRLEHASRVRVGAARLGHTGKVLARWVLASRLLIARRRT